MDTNHRRKHILDAIAQSNHPLSASALAKELSVSRQIIVGDVALLRAQGHEIIATARGYMLPQFNETQYIGKVACKHSSEDTRLELCCIVDLDATVVNAIISHELYGEITGTLNLKTRGDVDAFIRKIESAEVKLLSELTAGIHLHTIACRDNEHFQQVYQALKTNGYLFHD